MPTDVLPLPHQIKIFNDNVMGGQSNSRVRIINQEIHFSGEVSLANNGGFASMRGRWSLVDDSKSHIKSSAIQITFKGEGKHYQFRLFTADNTDGSAYVANFDTKANETLTVRIPLSAFSASFRGRPIQKPTLKLNHILEYGLLIGDKQVGPFNFVLKRIKVVK